MISFDPLNNTMQYKRQVLLSPVAKETDNQTTWMTSPKVTELVNGRVKNVIQVVWFLDQGNVD